MPESRYVVRYNSDGKIQFEETWAVRRARLRCGCGMSGGRERSYRKPPPLEGPIQQSACCRTDGRAAARPVKGPGYGASRVAFTMKQGNWKQCSALRTIAFVVDEPPGLAERMGPVVAAYRAEPLFVDGETPAGLINGSTWYSPLQDSPVSGFRPILYRNGLLQSKAWLLHQRQCDYLCGRRGYQQPGDVLTVFLQTGLAPGPGRTRPAERGSRRYDTGGATRGDLIVAAGTAPTTWKRLPLGPANRMPVSNGEDAVWNTCLF